jgi:hypothetical protein
MILGRRLLLSLCAACAAVAVFTFAAGGASGSLTTVTLDQPSSYIAAKVDGHLVLGATPRQLRSALGPPGRRVATTRVTTLYYGARRNAWTWRITLRSFGGCPYRRVWSVRSEAEHIDSDSGRALVRPRFGIDRMVGEIRRDLDRYDPVGWTLSMWRDKNGGTFSGSDAKEGQRIDVGITRAGARMFVVRLSDYGTIPTLPPQFQCR